MLDLMYAALVVATITTLATALRTGPLAIGRHLAHYPGTLFVGCVHGAFIAVALWGCSMLTPWLASVPYLTTTALLWMAVHIVLEAHSRPADARGSGARLGGGAINRGESSTLAEA